MRTNTTNSAKGNGLRRLAREENLEDYLLRTLSEEDWDAFEEHYFESHAGTSHFLTEPRLGAK